MANVEAAALRRFVTERFVQQTLAEDVYQASMHEVALSGDVPPAPAQLAAGNFVESRGWLALGAQIGYFDEVPLLAGEADARKLAAQTVALGNPRWPVRFRRLASSLGDRDASIKIPGELEYGDRGALAIFQAAFVLAHEFRHPLLGSLQRCLQFPHSPLDTEPAHTSANDVFAAIQEARDAAWEDSQARCIGGFMQLVDLLAAFDSLFPELERHDPLTRKIRAENLSRLALARTTANLLTWRLNLSDKRTVHRLRVVSEAFWNLCEHEFDRYPELPIRWSAGDSRGALSEMLARWLDRADPDEAVIQMDFRGFMDPGSSSFTPQVEPGREGV